MNRPYFQFPLCALRLPDSQRERLDCIISYCCIEVGTHEWKKLTDQQRHAWSTSPPVSWWRDAKVDPTKMATCESDGGSDGSKRQTWLRSFDFRYGRLSRFVAEFECKHIVMSKFVRRRISCSRRATIKAFPFPNWPFLLRLQ